MSDESGMLGLNRNSFILKMMRAASTPGFNPYSRTNIRLIEERRYPPVSQSTYVILLVFGVLHLMVIWSCFLVIVVPLLSHESKRRKYLWGFKRVYASSISKSFIVPNSALAVATTQFLSSSLCLVYVALQYLSFASHEAASRVSLYALIQIMWLFNFYGHWITGWAALCTVLCSPLPQIPGFIRSLASLPHVVNGFCITVPFIMTAFAMFETIILAMGHRDESAIYRKILRNMSLNADVAEAGGTPTVAMQSQMFGQLADLVDIVSTLSSRMRVNGICWAALGIFTLLFLAICGFSLVHLLRDASCQIHDLKLTRTQVKHGTTDTRPTMATVSTTHEVKNILQKGYTYLLCHTLVMMSSILYTIAICILVACKAPQIVLASYWRALSSWLYLISGLVIAIAMILQSWRIFVDLDILIPEKGQASSVADGDFDGQDSVMSGASHSIDDDLADVKVIDMSKNGPQIQQARYGVRRQPAQVVILRRAF